MNIATTWAYFPLIPGTKEPAVNWREVKIFQYSPHGNYGIPLTETDCVIDADPRNYPEGRNVLEELLTKHPLPQTRIVKTPRGGFHFYYKKPPDMKIKVKQDEYPGIDFLSAGAFVVGPGTYTIASANSAEGTYQLIQDMEPAELPVTLLATLQPPPQAVLEGSAESLLMLDKYVAECKVADPAIQGKFGDNTTLALAHRGRDLGLPLEAVFRVMRDEWNHRCQPPWNEGDLYKKVQNAFTYARGAAGQSSPEAAFMNYAPTHAPDAPKDNVARIEVFQEDLVVKGLHMTQLSIDPKSGKILDTLANVVFILRHDPAWRGRLKYNEFSSNLEFSGRPHWRENKLNEGLDMSARDVACMRAWFSTAGHVRMEVSEATMHTAALTAATPYHPVKDWLEDLKWDGRPRLDRILIDTAGADNNPGVTGAGRCVILSAVKRIYEPGCKNDYVMVLESKQGIGKSTWIATLGGPWYSASELVRGDKDTYQNLRGRWFVELPEINATFSKADFNWLKGVISNASDVYRGSYERVARSVPRESVFIATINPNASSEYLKDDENRRYWPIRTGKFDNEALKRDREQYFAEAVHRYKQGEQNWLTELEESYIRPEQDARREQHPWLTMLEPWANQRAGGFTPNDVYAAMGIAPEHAKSHHRAQLYSILKQLGFVYSRGIGNTGMWFKPEVWEAML